jgi:WbqC-like protein family.
MKILPLTYLGNIEYFSELCSGEKVTIDLGENYVKQTFRNRCEIMTAGGVTALTVNVVKGRSINKKAVSDIRIDYSKRWMHQHRISLVSAYRNSPYFDHYWEKLDPFYLKEFTFLADLNRELITAVLGMLKLQPEFSYSDGYIHAGEADEDMRGSFAPKLRDTSTGSIKHSSFPVRPYTQVFSENLPFAPNLSVIDLILCEGPAARDIILRREL